MGNENTGRKSSRIVGHRKKLSDISNSQLPDVENTPLLLKSRKNDENPREKLKGSWPQLQEELEKVKKLLEEKEHVLEESKRCMEKLWFNYCRKTKQNEEIILHNSQLYRDLTQARDQLKVLQHENVQMSAIYKVCKLEMQEKLKEALEQVDYLTKLVKASSLDQISDKQCPGSIEVGQIVCENTGDVIQGNLLGIDGKSALRKRERKSYKELSLKMKLRNTDGGIIYSSDFVQLESDLVASGPAELKGNEVSASAASCSTELRRAGKSARQTKASLRGAGKGPAESKAEKDRSLAKALLECTEKVLAMPKSDSLLPSAHKPEERPHRRAASSVGSYKEPSLVTKMRRQ